MGKGQTDGHQVKVYWSHVEKNVLVFQFSAEFETLKWSVGKNLIIRLNIHARHLQFSLIFGRIQGSCVP